MSVPSLQDILFDKSNEKTPYNKHNFIRYLSSIHCLENYEFIIEVNKFNKLLKDSGRDKEKVLKWNGIVKQYLLDDSPKELNLSYQVKSNLFKHKIPTNDSLKKAYKIIYELLLDSYNQFISVTKKQYHGSHGSQSHGSGGGSSSNSGGHSHAAQSLPIPIQGRRNSSSLNLERRGSTCTNSRRNSVIDFRTSSSSNTRKNSSSSNLPSGNIFSQGYSLSAAISNSGGSSASRSNSGTGSRRPSVSVTDYPRSPINNGTHLKTNITKLPSPSSDVESKKKPSSIPTSNPSSLSQNQSLFKMKKFKFRRNSNE